METRDDPSLEDWMASLVRTGGAGEDEQAGTIFFSARTGWYAGHNDSTVMKSQ